MKNTIMLIILSLALVGCGEPTIDGSSDAAMKASIKEIALSLSKEKKEQFGNAYVSLVMAEGFANLGSDDAVEMASDKVRSEIDGMTYAEVVAFAELKKSERAKPVKRLSFEERLAAEKKANLKKTKYYFPKVELYKVSATRNDSGNPRIDFKLKNTGDKTLKIVKVTFWFKDKKGTVIHENDYYPVSSTDTPLKPNYIWKQTRRMAFGGHDVPSEWKEGSFDAKITEIEFTE